MSKAIRQIEWNVHISLTSREVYDFLFWKFNNPQLKHSAKLKEYPKEQRFTAERNNTSFFINFREEKQPYKVQVVKQFNLRHTSKEAAI